MTEKVYLVDDDASVLKAVGRLLRSAGIAVESFDSAAAFLSCQDSRMEGCLVLDISMPGMSGMELQRILSKEGSQLPVVFLTGTGDVPTAVKALKNGAVNFLSKPCEDRILLEAVEEAMEAGRVVRKQKRALDQNLARFAGLTPREFEVMLGVTAGLLNKQIADELGASEKTIKVHRGRVMQKVGVTSVAELVRLTERAGIGRR